MREIACTHRKTLKKWKKLTPCILVMPPATRPTGPTVFTPRLQPQRTLRPASPPQAVPTSRITTVNRRRIQTQRSIPPTNRNIQRTQEISEREREYERLREQNRRQLIFWQSQQKQNRGQSHCADRSQWYFCRVARSLKYPKNGFQTLNRHKKSRILS